MQLWQLLKLSAAMGATVAVQRLAYRLKRVRTMSHFEERVWGVGVPLLATSAIVGEDWRPRQVLLAVWALFAAAGVGYLVLQQEDKHDYNIGQTALEVERWLNEAIAGGERGTRTN